MARTRTTKKLAQRIDLNYFKRPTPLKRAKFWLGALLPLFALIWIAERAVSRDARAYSSGRLSRAHAVLEKECAVCHLRQAGAFSARAANSACLSCHDGPIHHSGQSKPPECAECHSEHRGHVDMRAASNQNCAACHSDLNANGGMSAYAAHIRSFEDGHPQFAALREGAHDRGTIKMNHAIHLKPIQRGPNGPTAQLGCSDCHRPAAAKADWPYSDPKYMAAKPSYGRNGEILLVNTQTLAPRNPATGRELMAPVKFANACAACHLLTFDKRFDEGVPHDKPEAVHAFVVKRFAEYIAAHANELHEMQDPGRDLTGKPLPPRTRTLTPSEWVAERTAVAEELLWHKTCSQCHALTGAALQDTSLGRWSAASSRTGTPPPAGDRSRLPMISASPLPTITPASATLKWMPHAKFDHDAHRAFTCISCHEKALTSTESTDILLPGIATCQTCHAPGPDHAESRCFECHTYHDWSQRKEISPTYTLPSLRTGGR